MKQCFTCRQDKPLDGFYKCKRHKDGHAGECKVCVKARTALHREQVRKPLRAFRKANGLCYGCGKRPEREGAFRCEECQAKDYLAGLPHRAEAGPCIICGFLLSDVHHIDGNHKNNAAGNLVNLCPNHHRLVHRGYLCLLHPTYKALNGRHKVSHLP